MRVKSRFLAAVLAASCLVVPKASAVEPADRTATVGSDGVMRWAEDGREVAVFGVNYYAPFALDYRLLGERGFDRKETIRRDVAHFRRLGLTALRLHVFDREISTKDGALRDNDHLDLLDYLVSVCASNGLYTVLTPIAAWGGGAWTSDEQGFAASASMAELTTDRRLWQIQARYEEAFARHVNRYTGRRYADDPAVLCFELVNEPAYTNGTPPEAVAAYANALLDGIRRSGTKKPVLYSATWNFRHASVPHLRTDGVTGVCYATGLRAGAALPGLQLARVRASSLKSDPRLAGKAKVIYEFDAADTPGAYMYPAMAALFRSEDAQAAMQFQYEATPLAGDNASYKTHYLNLVYTPEKAISLAIAAEVFRRTPRGTPYRPDAREIVFPPFRVDAVRNLSEMVTETALYYTAPPVTPIPTPERLTRVYGCGASAVAASGGSGAYFLDRVDEGLWRLQVYPSVLPVADPYTGKPGAKTVVLGDDVKMKVSLPDLGAAFAVHATPDGRSVARADAGVFTVAPGDYVLSREADPSSARLAAARAADIAPYCAPPADPPGERRPWPRPLAQRAAELKTRFAGRDEADLLGEPVRLRAGDYLKKGFFDARRTVDAAALAQAFPSAGAAEALTVRGRSRTDHDEPVEIACTFADGSVWGCEVTLPTGGGEIRLPVVSLRHFPRWDQMPDPPKGTVPRLEELVSLSFAIGEWMEKGRRAVAHDVEIESVRMVGRPEPVAAADARNPMTPFLVVTGRPTREEVERKVAALKADGFDAFVCYARSGLELRYMEEEWLARIDWYCTAAAANGMKVWIYDDYNWPSGTCRGRVPNENPAFRYSEWGVSRASDGSWIWEKAFSPRGWVNYCDEGAMARFVELTHEVYARRLAKHFAAGTVAGFFSDEPNYPAAISFARKPLVRITRWDGLEDEYRAATGRDFRADVEASCAGGDAAVWEAYGAIRARRIRRNYFDRIADWCRRHGVESTGHMMYEHSPTDSCRAFGNPLFALKGETVPGIDEVGTRIAFGEIEWVTFGVAQHAATRNRNGGLAELFALGQNDMTPARLRQMLWLCAFHGIDRYVTCMEVMDQRGLVEKHGYLSPLEEGQPWRGRISPLVAEAKRAARLARRLDYARAAAVRYPQRAALRAAYAKGPAPALAPLLGAIESRGLAFDLVEEDEATARPFVFEVRGGTYEETRTGTRFDDPDRAADWLRARTKSRVRFFGADGAPAREVAVREYPDGSWAALDLRGREARPLVVDVAGVRHDCLLPARGVFACAPGELPPDPVPAGKPVAAKAFDYTLDRDNVFRVNFGTNRLGRFELAAPLKGVRPVVRDYSTDYAVTERGRPVGDYADPLPGTKVFRHVRQEYVIELDGRILAAAKPCSALLLEYNPLYREAEPIDLEAGEHAVRLVSGDDDRNFFLPAFLLAGAFAAQGETLRPLPERLALGSLAAQGLDGFAGAVTYHLGELPEGTLVADVGNAFASLAADGVDLGTRAWAPYAWALPKGGAKRIDLTVYTSVVNICGDVGHSRADWDLDFWLSPRDAENRPGLHGLYRSSALPASPSFPVSPVR